ncbi:MAG: DUF1972 domain-containing protein [Solobacterium sp.]|jgi:rhamnosyltransferase|nr:DUF1972 domain-containing protein [Solobacterium sp.]
MKIGMQHIFIIGSKGCGNYGGYETFVDKLTEMHMNKKNIKYHIACKMNGKGFMDEHILKNAISIDETHFEYHNADCFKIHVPESLGSAQAIYYDIEALKQSIAYCREQHIENPIFYILACRIGPFIGKYAKKIHELRGMLYVNPDGHEWMRAKWSKPVRWYWKESEKGMVKHADLLVCDSINIEKYIKEEYEKFSPKTIYIAYGSDTAPSKLNDNDTKYVSWLNDHKLKAHQYYCSVGRFVPENNFEIMIREFMQSKTNKDFAIITTKDDKFLIMLDEKLHFKRDKRIKFVGTVYDKELLKKIREDAYGYFHGHEVGGTNPSLLEALSSTKINLLYDVGFNKEVAEGAALYWNKMSGNLASLIDYADRMSSQEIKEFGEKAKRRIEEAYSWQYISDKYLILFEDSGANN